MKHYKKFQSTFRVGDYPRITVERFQEGETVCAKIIYEPSEGNRQEMVVAEPILGYHKILETLMQGVWSAADAHADLRDEQS